MTKSRPKGGEIQHKTHNHGVVDIFREEVVVTRKNPVVGPILEVHSISQLPNTGKKYFP